MSNVKATKNRSTNLAFLFRSLKNPLFNRTFSYQSVHGHLSSLTQAMGAVHGLYRKTFNFDLPCKLICVTCIHCHGCRLQSNRMITELFYSHNLTMNRGSLFKEFQAYAPLRF